MAVKSSHAEQPRVNRQSTEITDIITKIKRAIAVTQGGGGLPIQQVDLTLKTLDQKTVDTGLTGTVMGLILNFLVCDDGSIGIVWEDEASSRTGEHARSYLRTTRRISLRLIDPRRRRGLNPKFVKPPPRGEHEPRGEDQRKTAVRIAPRDHSARLVGVLTVRQMRYRVEGVRGRHVYDGRDEFQPRH